ncbi:MAG: helix-turn-helix transcriptional regulator [Candidatus Limnocylindrales bacterium]
MATRERRVTRGMVRGEQQTRAIGVELREARLRAGLSQRRVAEATGVGRSTIQRFELGRLRDMSIRTASIVGAVVGIDVVVRTYQAAGPIRDAAQVALLGRLRARLGPAWTWSLEVPLPIAGDQRAWDAGLRHQRTGARVMVEAETRIRDVQDLLRRLALKSRDSGRPRVVLLVAGTHANRSVVRLANAELGAQLPCPGRRALAALADGDAPEADALVLL